MVAAISQLQPLPDYLLLDALELDLPIEQKALIHGDMRSASIAAASILAKVERDRRMEEYDQLYPQYGLAQHKGYGTPEHLAALRQHGPTPLAPVFIRSCKRSPLLVHRCDAESSASRGAADCLRFPSPSGTLVLCYPLRHHIFALS